MELLVIKNFKNENGLPFFKGQKISVTKSYGEELIKAKKAKSAQEPKKKKQLPPSNATEVPVPEEVKKKK